MSSQTISSGSIAITNADQAIDLHGIFSNLTLWSDSGSAAVSVNLNNVAAVLDANATVKVEAGASNKIEIEESAGGISGFHFIGASAAGRLNWMAW